MKFNIAIGDSRLIYLIVKKSQFMSKFRFFKVEIGLIKVKKVSKFWFSAMKFNLAIADSRLIYLIVKKVNFRQNFGF